MLVGIFIVPSLHLTGASVRWHFVNFLVDDSSSCALLPFQRFTSSVLKPPFCLNWQPFSSHYHPPSLLSSHHLLFSPFQDLAFLSFSITAHFSHLITKISSSHSPQVKDTGLTLVWRWVGRREACIKRWHSNVNLSCFQLFDLSKAFYCITVWSNQERWALLLPYANRESFSPLKWFIAAGSPPKILNRLLICMGLCLCVRHTLWDSLTAQ